MLYFITGATGYIGAALAESLIGSGAELRVLVREPGRAGFLSGKPGVELVRGSLEDDESLRRLTEGCEGGFHLAGLAKAEASDPGAWDRVNVEGAAAVARAAAKAGARRLLHCSSAGVLGPSLDGKEQTENSARQLPFLNEYERSKAASEQAVLMEAGGALEIVIVNPTRVYGPSPSRELTPYNRLLSRYLEGRWRILPGDGNSVGDYAYIDDVIGGMRAAFDRGRPGGRYLLGGASLSYDALFSLAAEVSGVRKGLVRVPLPLLSALAGAAAAAARLAGKDPEITPSWVRRFTYDWRVSSAKAERELGYRKTPAEEGMRATVEWLRSQAEARAEGGTR